MARAAKGFGAGSPILLANDYGLIRADHFSPTEKILIDNQLLNRLIEAENEAYDKAKGSREADVSMPGLEKRLSIDDIIERQATGQA